MTMIVVNYIVSDADSIMQVCLIFWIEGGCWNLVFSLWSLILDLWFWSRWSQGVTLGVFSIMYLILVILMTRSFLNEVYLIIISYVVLASFFGIEVGDLLDHHGLIIVRFDLRNWERHQCQSQSRANTPLTVEYEKFPLTRLWYVHAICGGVIFFCILLKSQHPSQTPQKSSSKTISLAASSLAASATWSWWNIYQRLSNATWQKFLLQQFKALKRENQEKSDFSNGQEIWGQIDR